MENILPLIIMLIVGAFLSGKKKQKPGEQEKAKPFTTQQENPGGPVKKLKEMYKEIQQEMEQEATRQQGADPEMQRSEPPRVQVDLAPKPVQTKVSPKRESRDGSRASSRKSTRHQNKHTVKKQQNKLQVESIIPKSQEDLIKGVIFSEIIGPPKSKR